jgi:hypothetical protein
MGSHKTVSGSTSPIQPPQPPVIPPTIKWEQITDVVHIRCDFLEEMLYSSVPVPEQFMVRDNNGHIGELNFARWQLDNRLYLDIDVGEDIFVPPVFCKFTNTENDLKKADSTQWPDWDWKMCEPE